jgi:hypothetical protein
MVIDTLATGPECAGFCDQLRAQFPDVILIVAGTTEDQTELVKYITAGDIYRFLHKPVSPPRARNAIDAAVRRHIEGRTITAAAAEPSERPSRWQLYAGLGAATLLIAGVATAFLLSDDGADAPQVAATSLRVPFLPPICPPPAAVTSQPAANEGPCN